MIVSVQVARAIAALLVVTWHFSAVYNDILPRGTSLGTPAFLLFGYAGVDLFFVISGFIISLITDREDFRFSDFMVRRAIRILPFYALFTGVFWVALMLVGRAGGIDASFAIVSMLAVPIERSPLLFVGWSLEHEFVFYWIAGALLWRGHRSAVAPVLGALFVVGVVKNAFFPGVWDWHVFSMYHLEFLLGVLVYQHRHQISRLGSAVPLALGAAGFLATAAVLSHLPGDHGASTPAGWGGFVRIVGYGLASALFLVGLLNAEERLRSSGLRHAALVGDASFALYLSHPIVLPALGRASGALHVGPGMLIPALGFAVAVTLGFSIVFFLAIERPLLRYAARLRIWNLGASH